MSDLRLQVILGVLDKASAPLKKLKQGSGQTGQSLEELKAKLAGLQKQSRLMDSLKAGQEAFQKMGRDIGVAKAQLQAMQLAGNASESQMKKQRALIEKLTASYNKKKTVLIGMRSQLNRMGGGALATQEALRQKIDATTAALKRQQETQERLDRYAKAHSSALMRSGAAAAFGAGTQPTTQHIYRVHIADYDLDRESIESMAAAGLLPCVEVLADDGDEAMRVAVAFCPGAVHSVERVDA
ncbi:MAG: hypothetical protein Q4A98_00750 [Comamonadaceae bacterium]|nr:hypothetical protein [Comamonadaceae bacterium]